jgi:NAD(P)-dependent dehydrogenase (short-subunit alcohol dehydrogenase family)
MTVIFDYSGHHVFITGGSGGIGSAIGRAFRDAGAAVTVTGLQAEALAYEVDLSGMTYRQLDVLDHPAIERVAGEVEALDVLVNCAGTSRPGEEYEPDTFDDIVGIHLGGSFRMASALLEPLKGSRGTVINIASMTSFFGWPRVPGYGAGKAAIVQLTKTLATAWAGDGIRVNAIAPGWITTKLTAGIRKLPEVEAGILGRTPMGRWGAPEEVAGVALFLASPAASFITGVTLPVDGGFSAD